MPAADEIAERAVELRGRVDAVAERAGRDPATVRILAVTKTWPVEVCRAALAAGLPMLGENRVQEAEAKVAALPDAEWHLVGSLQSNKVRRAVAAFDVIHSIDSNALVERVERAAHDARRRPRILLQVNTTAEPQKGGLVAGEALAPALLAALRNLRHAQPVGLMTIGRAGGDAHEPFAALRRLRDELEQRAGVPLPELSMGMSADWQAAVREGATLLRIGTALFGGRPA
ncbi:MAG: YggS family pyridoxal phosphate-dependent enzyme [Chloroflexota bacterium]